MLPSGDLIDPEFDAPIPPPTEKPIFKGFELARTPPTRGPRAVQRQSLYSTYPQRPILPATSRKPSGRTDRPVDGSDDRTSSSISPVGVATDGGRASVSTPDTQRQSSGERKTEVPRTVQEKTTARKEPAWASHSPVPGMETSTQSVNDTPTNERPSNPIEDEWQYDRHLRRVKDFPRNNDIQTSEQVADEQPAWTSDSDEDTLHSSSDSSSSSDERRVIRRPPQITSPVLPRRRVSSIPLITPEISSPESRDHIPGNLRTPGSGSDGLRRTRQVRRSGSLSSMEDPISPLSTRKLGVDE